MAELNLDQIEADLLAQIKATNEERIDSEEDSIMPDPVDPQPKTITVGGLKLEVETQVDPQQVVRTAEHGMKERAKAAKDDPETLDSWRKQAIRGNKLKFGFVDPTEKSEEVLKETSSLMTLVSNLKEQLDRFELGVVFDIQDATIDDQGTVQYGGSLGDLFHDFGSLTKEQVAGSNRYFRIAVKGDMHAAVLQCLTWSEDCIKNNMTDSLEAKVMETYRSFLPEERGGPLLFKVMMDQLLINTRDSADHLINKLKNFDLKNIQGEDVGKLTTMVRAVEKRLENMKDPTTKRPYLPDDLNVTLLRVLQTTSVDGFNKIFDLIETQAKAAAVGDANPNYPSVTQLLAKGDKIYQQMIQKNEWTGVTTQGRGHEASFVATGGTSGKGKSSEPDWMKKAVCDNCGKKGHIVKTCTKPRDEAKIKAAQKARADKKKKRGTGPKKFSPPTDVEKAHGGQRIIDGKVFKWNSQTNFWDKQSVNLVEVPAPAPAPGPAPAPAPAPAANGSSGASVMSQITGGTAMTAERRALQAARVAELGSQFTQLMQLMTEE